MFVLVAGPRAAEADGVLERMAAALSGGVGAPRLWRDDERNAGAASLAPDFVPEDAWDVQPIADGRRVFVCQARVDNREELLAQLGIDEDIADSTLLAAAYDRWGADCVDRLVGDYVFAAWHRADGRVVAAVDPLGTPRLLWTRIGDGIALSAQLRALLAHPHVSHEPDLVALAGMLNPGIDRTTTPFRDVRALPGGHRLLWRDGQAKVERWWNPPSRPSVWYRDSGDYVAEVREMLTRAVGAQLRSSSPVSTTLSGGLDSGVVTATAARLLAARGARLPAYTSVPEGGLAPWPRPNWDADDRAYAAEVVAAYDNIEHRLVTPDGRCTLDVLPAIHERSCVPPKSATNQLWLDRVVQGMAAEGSRVLLLGQHGNFAFSWRGEAAVWELMRSGRVRAALAQASAEAREERTSVARVLARAARGALRVASGATFRGGLDLPGLVFVQQRLRPRASSNEYAEAPGSQRFRVISMTTPKNIWWPEPVAQWGIEFRDPLADRRLLERLLQYPQYAFRLGGRDRGLAREAAAGLLPDRVRLRRTQGAQVPEAPSRIAAHAACYRRALGAMRASHYCRELFDFAALDDALGAFVRGTGDCYRAVAYDRALAIGLFVAGLERGA